MSRRLEDYIPNFEGKENLMTEGYIFYVNEEDQSISSFSNVTGEEKELFSLIKETDSMQNRYSRMETRPRANGGMFDTYRFLITAEIDRQFNMCFLFSYDMKRKNFSENVK